MPALLTPAGAWLGPKWWATLYWIINTKHIAYISLYTSVSKRIMCPMDELGLYWPCSGILCVMWRRTSVWSVLSVLWSFFSKPRNESHETNMERPNNVFKHKTIPKVLLTDLMLGMTFLYSDHLSNVARYVQLRGVVVAILGMQCKHSRHLVVLRSHMNSLQFLFISYSFNLPGNVSRWPESVQNTIAHLHQVKQPLPLQ